MKTTSDMKTTLNVKMTANMRMTSNMKIKSEQKKSQQFLYISMLKFSILGLKMGPRRLIFLIFISCSKVKNKRQM